MIRFQQTQIGYKKALISIENLELESSAIYALVGRNGSGKSTFLKTITGQISLLGGNLEIDARSTKEVKVAELSRIISFVESKFDGVSFLSVENYLALGRAPFTNALGRLSSDDWGIVHEVAEEMGLTEFLVKDTTNLSDGERQLCAIARALVQQTPILLLDEPTAFLDFANKQLLIDKLLHIAKEKQKCIIFSTHDLDLCIENKIEFLALKNKILNKISCQTKDELIRFLEEKE
jgi:iron complex transport system ATP-binding protein